MVRFARLFRQRKYSLIFIVCLSLVMSFSSGVMHVAGATSPAACAVTPSLLGGQGFSVSGQGFSVSGQGFSVSGQGFSVSGQGFSVSGQGLDPLVVAAEIKNNPVTPGKWVKDRLDFFMQRLGFNTDSTAILIVDEFTSTTSGVEAHGITVKKVVDDSIAAIKAAVPSLKIDSFAVDISDANTKYNADVIRDNIVAKVNSLQGTYHHFVLNMSFGLISCSDPGTTTTPAFNFNDALQVIAANNQTTPSLAITPILECVAKVSSDDHYSVKSRVSNNRHDDSPSYVAYFGYKNENGKLVSISIGADNKFSPSPDNQSQPDKFEPGQQHFVFAVKFNGSNLTWSLKGPDGQTRLVTVSKYSTPCATPPATPTQSITPVVECVANTASGVYEARFGYNNPNGLGKNIPVGYKNTFTPTPADRGQVTTFIPGSHPSVFRVSFNGSDLKWTLNGITVTANSSTKACPEQQGFGVSQYLTQNLGVPQNQVDDYWNHLAGSVTTDEFQSLRLLLRDYLLASKTGNITVVPVASSGNLRPWLGAPALAPASWKETIAVGATLDDSTNRWSFSQDANVMAPGVGYPLGNNRFAAGTSFAAPAFSVLAGMCSTVPNALKFDGTNPPLILSGGVKVFSNTVIGTADLGPLACKPNNKPIITPIVDRSDKEGTVVSFQVIATDPDNDALTFSATNLPAGVTISSSGLISGTIAANSAGTYAVTVTAKDNVTPQGSASTSFTWVVTPGQVTVRIDIRPHSPSNRINLTSRGFVAVAVFGSATFDATAIDPSTVTLAGAPAVKLFNKFYTLTFDVDHDGKIDRILWFKANQLQLTPTSTQAVLLGQTYYGGSFRGVDKVKIVPPSAPRLVSPSSGKIVSDVSVNLKWSDNEDWEEGDNTCYSVQISTSAGFTTLVQGAIVVDHESMTTTALSNGTYYWRVAFSDCSSGTVSPWSDVWNFTVQH